MCQGDQGLNKVRLKKGAKDKKLSLKLFSESGELAEGYMLLGGEGTMVMSD